MRNVGSIVREGHAGGRSLGRRVVGAVGLALLLVLVGASMYWAGRTAVVPPALPGDVSVMPTYRVATGTVGSTERVSVSASWPTRQTIPTGGSGVVTSVLHAPGTLIDSGSVVATVNLGPIVVVEGAVPIFRTLMRGVSGPDVRQWQTFLVGRGLLAKATGTFDAATASATKAFRRSIGAGSATSIGPESLLFVTGLPAPAEVVPAVGDRIATGEPLLRVLAASPDFIATLSSAERAELRTGMAIALTAPDGASWHGTLGTFSERPEGGYAVAIEGRPCGTACGAVPVAGTTQLTGSIILVPETAGVVIPTSALTEEPAAGLTVTLEDGSMRPVTVRAEANGFAVVDGLPADTVIRLPAPPAS